MPSARFIYIADVFCPWCFAFGPIMKRIADEHPDLPVSVIGGNLISRPITLEQDYAADPGLIDFWREVEETSGRSLEGAIRAALSGDSVRLFSPGADEILIILKNLSPGRELEQLLYLENMFYGEGRDIFSADSFAKIAADWKVDANQFEAALDQPAVVRSTEESLEKASRLMGEITSYPSVLLERNGRIDAVSRGYVHYATVAARLADAMRDLGVKDQSHLGSSRHGACTLGKCR